MGDSYSRKPGVGPGGTPPAAPSPAAGDEPVAPPDELSGRAGRIVHDERGNAIWSWIKETSRAAIESTSHLLKKLEVPELTMEDTQNNELKLESDRDAGGGYNPYGGSTPGGKASAPRGSGSAAFRGGAAKSSGSASGGSGSSGAAPGGAASGRTGPGTSRSGSNSSNSNIGGGYDPYGKSATRKPGR